MPSFIGVWIFVYQQFNWAPYKDKVMSIFRSLIKDDDNDRFMVALACGKMWLLT